MFNGAVSSESVNTPDAGLLMQLRVERAKMTKLMHYADTIARERDKCGPLKLKRPMLNLLTCYGDVAVNIREISNV
jgi:hypothetical protein